MCENLTYISQKSLITNIFQPLLNADFKKLASIQILSFNKRIQKREKIKNQFQQYGVKQCTQVFEHLCTFVQARESVYQQSNEILSHQIPGILQYPYKHTCN